MTVRDVLKRLEHKDPNTKICFEYVDRDNNWYRYDIRFGCTTEDDDGEVLILEPIDSKA